MTRLVFMGTPEFAVPSLDALLRSPHRVVAAYTRPDKPAGRSRTPVPSPVKRHAEAAGIPVEQPKTLRPPAAVERLESYRPDVLVLVAYGLILPRTVLDLPRFGVLNVHPSLLPRHRGPAPITGALLAGEKETGVTIMLLDEGVDTGPILAQVACPIGPDETAGSLTTRLAQVGASLLCATLDQWLAGEIQPRPQDDAAATYTRQLTKEDGRIDWHLPAVTLARRIRAFNPWPAATTSWNGKLLKVLRAKVVDWTGVPIRDDAGDVWETVPPVPDEPPGPPHASPGLVLPKAPPIVSSPIAVVTGDGLLAVEELQIEGRRAMGAAEFLRGQPSFLGCQLE